MKIEGLTEFERDLGERVRRIDGDVSRSQQQTADEGVRIAQDLAPKRRPVLAPSITGEVKNTGEGSKAEWGPAAEHGRYLELGTSKMAPRPFLSPSLDRVLGPAEKRLGDDVGRL